MPEKLAGPVQMEPWNAEMQASLSVSSCSERSENHNFPEKSFFFFMCVGNCKKQPASIPLTRAKAPPQCRVAQEHSNCRLADGMGDLSICGKLFWAQWAGCGAGVSCWVQMEGLSSSLVRTEKFSC